LEKKGEGKDDSGGEEGVGSYDGVPSVKAAVWVWTQGGNQVFFFGKILDENEEWRHRGTGPSADAQRSASLGGGAAEKKKPKRFCWGEGGNGPEVVMA